MAWGARSDTAEVQGSEKSGMGSQDLAQSVGHCCPLSVKSLKANFWSKHNSGATVQTPTLEDILSSPSVTADLHKRRQAVTEQIHRVRMWYSKALGIARA